jgi:hypothetical protein
VEDFRDRFTLSSEQRLTCRADLDAAAVEDVLHSIYRPLGAHAQEPIRVTFSLDVLVLRPRDRVVLD